MRAARRPSCPRRVRSYAFMRGERSSETPRWWVTASGYRCWGSVSVPSNGGTKSYWKKHQVRDFVERMERDFVLR